LALRSAERRADLVIAHRYEILTLDPQRMSHQQDFRMAAALYEGLLVLDPVTAEPIAGTAERWSVSPDGLMWTFTLRDSARWSNGDPVTSMDFIVAWSRALHPDTAADYSGQFFVIDGGREFFEWRQQALAELARGERLDPEALARESAARFEATVGLSAPDSRTLVLRLARPTPYLLDLLCLGVFAPVHRATIERFTSVDPQSGRVRTDHRWTRPGTLVSNGAYQLERWRYKRDLRLRRNPRYWNADSVRLETIDVIPIEDSSTAVLAFESGAVDWVPDVVVEYRADLLEERERYLQRHQAQFAALRAEGLSVDAAIAALPPPRHSGERRDIRAYESFGTDFFSFNCRPTLADGRPNPLADPAVRRAFSMAIDKELLVSEVTRLNERPSGSLIPRGSITGYSPPDGLPFDPEAARRLLAERGWSDRDGDGRVEDAGGTPFPTIDLLYASGSARYADLALALRDLWQRELGVSIEVRAKDSRFVKDDLQRGNFMIARGGWYGDYGDPLTFLDLSRTGDGNNDRAYSSPHFDALLEAADREPDPQARLALLAEAERFMLEEGPPLLPLCTYRTISMYRPGELRGLTEHPRLEQYLGRLWIERQSDHAQ
jgi:oligopeptide transport system substrate-binding protein